MALGSIPDTLHQQFHPLRQFPVPTGLPPHIQTLPQDIAAQVHRHLRAHSTPLGLHAQLRPALQAGQEQPAPSALRRSRHGLERTELARPLCLRIGAVLVVLVRGNGPSALVLGVRLVLPRVRHGIGGHQPDVTGLVPHVLDPGPHEAGHLPHPVDVHGLLVVVGIRRSQPALLLPLQLTFEVVKAILEVVVRPTRYDLGHLRPLRSYRRVQPPDGGVLERRELRVLQPRIEVIHVPLPTLFPRPLRRVAVHQRRAEVRQALRDDAPLERMLHLQYEIEEVFVLCLRPRLGERLSGFGVVLAAAAAAPRRPGQRGRRRTGLGRMDLAFVRRRSRRRVRVHHSRRRRRPPVVVVVTGLGILSIRMVRPGVLSAAIAAGEGRGAVPRAGTREFGAVPLLSRLGMGWHRRRLRSVGVREVWRRRRRMRRTSASRFATSPVGGGGGGVGSWWRIGIVIVVFF
mmetsp:Transcript_1160/g.2526  ORF Transcript_1160/g.2526 Transcript_1160/m.2526 type:complete len:458 (+) Transcript_1160:115-1488(+)